MSSEANVLSLSGSLSRNVWAGMAENGIYRRWKRWWKHCLQFVSIDFEKCLPSAVTGKYLRKKTLLFVSCIGSTSNSIIKHGNNSTITVFQFCNIVKIPYASFIYVSYLVVIVCHWHNFSIIFRGHLHNTNVGFLIILLSSWPNSHLFLCNSRLFFHSTALKLKWTLRLIIFPLSL